MTSTPQKRFLVTGGAGFIGSHLSELLVARGFHVTVVDDLSTGRVVNMASLSGNPAFQFVRASILDDIVLDRLASTADVVVHLAAAVGVKLIVERPVHTIETNIMGAEAVLRAALRYGSRVVIASTSEVYGKGVRIPFSEDDDVSLGPTCMSRWAYAASKMVDEFLGLAYHREHGLEVVPVRLFNTVGPRQVGRYGMVVPRFLQQALAGEPITVYGDGEQRRCFCDVRDVVEALADLAEHDGAAGRVFNVGSNEEVSINELAQRVQRLAGSASAIVHIPYSEAYAPGFEDMMRRVPDISRTRDAIGWSPTRTLDDILRDTLAYQRAQPEEGAASGGVE
ncbi:MAG TPA: GDP-mannose 4,6-dehydratase [Longimicrobiales bacterium]